MKKQRSDMRIPRVLGEAHVESGQTILTLTRKELTEMLSWINANIGTIIICIVLTAIVAIVIAILVKDRKKGKSPCGGNCGHCPMNGSCHGRV